MIYPRTLLLHLLFGIFFCHNCFSQFNNPISMELGGGGTVLYGDLQNKTLAFGTHIGLDYLFNPFISAGVQGLMGKLQGNDAYGREAHSKFAGANVNIKLRLGQFMAAKNNYSFYMLSHRSVLSYLANFYLGAGIGFIYADVTANRGLNANDFHEGFAGKDFAYEMIIPLNIGIDIPFAYSFRGPMWAVNINYQLGLSSGDNLDGYTNGYSGHRDRMVYLSLGIKRSIGNGLKF
ncbi:hypothetical protein [Olivibacter domesticus]|uniref:Outer membrane protein beta-barrel domain-containing protein n=1 Tax=Olivibacter domesticus TaxID=407022 RepID=A0A1H7YYS0_OLID1|nr:hypothetical protein [Olivibacter domesticus]SEM51135.1 hypothetical protein SAMN05661044_05386 [Olivibacter domesticus]